MIRIATQSDVAARYADVLEMRVMESADVSLIPGPRIPGIEVARIEITRGGVEAAVRRSYAALELILIAAGCMMISLIVNSCTSVKK